MKKTLKSFALCILSALMILSSLQIFHLDVQAEDTSGTLIATVSISGGDDVNYYQKENESSLIAFTRMWRAAVISPSILDKYISIKLEADWSSSSLFLDTGYLSVPKFRNVTLDLNGHIINRKLTNDSFSYNKNGAVFYLQDYAAMTIEDSNSVTEHAGSVVNNVWYPSTSMSGLATLVTLNGGVITGGASSSDGGGVVCAKGSYFTMHGGTLAGNMTSGKGGGISVDASSARVIIDSGHVMFNRSKEHGGGVYVDGGGFLALQSGDISYNMVAGDYYGGGIYSDSGASVSGYITGVSSTVAMTGGSVCHNTAQYGGGIYQDSGNVCLTGGTISDNTARKDGGGVYANGHNGTTTGVHLDGASITYNYAGADGGGFYSNTSYAEIHSGTITNNTAKSKRGSGIFIGLTDNLYLTGGKIVIQNNTVSNLYLRYSYDLKDGSLGKGSSVFISQSDFSSGSDKTTVSWTSEAATYNTNYMHADYTGYVIKRINGNVYIVKSSETEPTEGSAPTTYTADNATYAV